MTKCCDKFTLARLSKRFWSIVSVGEENACWEWRGAVCSAGYGKVGARVFGRRVTLGAHRVAWMLRCGSSPRGVFVLHRCDNRRCCNPGHLFLGTHQDNMNDMVAKGRQARALVNGRTKLSAEQVRSVRELRLAGLATSSIARVAGVSRAAIYYLLVGITHRWVA